MTLRVVLSTIALIATLLASPTALAEPGDYGFWKTVSNLFFPESANDPVSFVETQGMYPLSTPTSGFDYGFDPGRYDQWQLVRVPMETGAVCGNGSPFKFFVYRVPDTNNTLFYFEGGGACWDYASCSGQAGVRGARNPDGIPDDYVQNVNLLDFENSANLGTAAASPLIYTHHPYNRFKTGEWNLVYVPYCTGDIYIGDKTEVYTDPAGQNPSIVWHHNGIRNVQAVTSWVKNNLREPRQLAVAGCSAGGIGALLNYAKLRGHFGSRYAYLIDDSGPLYDAPLDSTHTDRYPSVLLHREVIESWTSQGVGDDPIEMLAAITPDFDTQRLASLYSGLSSKYPSDRLGMTHFLADGNFSSYSYERFYPAIENDPDPDSKLAKLRALWQQDTSDNLIPLLEATHNWSYYFPMFRDFNESHCTTVLDFRYGEIEELGLDLYDFVDNVVDYRGGAPLRAIETDAVSDFENNSDLLYKLIDSLL